MGIVWVIVTAAVVSSSTLGVVRAISCARLNRHFRAFAPSSQDVVRVIDGLRGDHPARRGLPRAASAAPLSIVEPDPEGRLIA
jgi:hypothetical protein